MAMPKIRSTAWYGCRRDTRDPRDVMFKPRAIKLPKAVDLREHCAPVMDQGDLGCCVGHGTTGAMRYLELKAGKPDTPLSRLFLYYNGRVVENAVSEDGGMEIRDAIKCAAAQGVPHEKFWPYDIAKFAQVPPPEAYTDAMNIQALTYERVQVNTNCVKMALASGFPVIIGVSLFDSFEGDAVAANGVVPFPNLKREQLVGGHCMLCVGYGQKPGYFTVRNSWNTDWGDKGDCYFPENYLGSTKYGSDYWIIKSMEFPNA